ncbi:MAG: TIM barrel protein [Nanoarchaeota archaeon]
MHRINTLLFGPAGAPLSCKTRDSAEGVSQTKKLGLGCMELEFVRGVRMGLDKAREVKRQAEQENIVLTAHGPYYINLNSEDKTKIQDSVRRILETARICHACGGWSIVFHAAYYMKLEKPAVYSVVKKNLQEIITTLNAEKNAVWIRPETTGKDSQFGTLQELLQLSQELERVMPCIDFSHLHARSNGKFNTYGEFRELLYAVEKALGKAGLHNMHCHISGINYGEKGEKNHLNLQESDLNVRAPLMALKEFDAKGVVISESPNIEGDALYMQKVYAGL